MKFGYVFFYKKPWEIRTPNLFWMCCILAALNTFDAVTTMAVVGSGLAVEANPLMAWFMAKYGLSAFGLLKGIISGAIVGFLPRFWYSPVAIYGVFWLILVYTLLAGWHVGSLFYYFLGGF